MSANVTITSTWGEKRTLKELGNAIERRRDVLKKQGTEGAVKSTAINVIKSLRSDTKVAKKNAVIIGDRWHTVIEESPYIAGWAFPGRVEDPFGRRVVRTSSSYHYVKNKKGKWVKKHNVGFHENLGPKKRRIVWLAGEYCKGENVKIFHVQIYNLEARDPVSPWHDLYCGAKSRADVVEYCRLRIQRRIGQYVGVSKRLLGLAMHKIAGTPDAGSAAVAASMPPNSKPLSNAELSKLANVRKSGAGFNSGNYALEFVDDLKMSAMALKSGPSGVNIAMQKAANATIAMLNRIADTDLAIPFPKDAKKAS